MGQYEKHVFVCTGGKVCPRQGSEQVLGELRVRIKEAGLAERVRINQSGCMSQCGWGPMVVVYPEDTWYGAVRLADVPDLISHLRGGAPIERLFHRPPGCGKQICPPGKEPIPPAPLSPPLSSPATPASPAAPRP
ncbi:MAG: (2Fe-2S) ferredoxin domain-containing protein [Planctomycetes bacterium]|nr:(2Fe-2S) ferredoxin domain-containing protein [Planctomycetota bacterium]